MYQDWLITYRHLYYFLLFCTILCLICSDFFIKTVLLLLTTRQMTSLRACVALLEYLVKF